MFTVRDKIVKAVPLATLVASLGTEVRRELEG